MDGGQVEAERATRVQQVIQDCIRRRVAGQELPDDQVIRDHSDLMPELGEELRKLTVVQRAEEQARRAPLSRQPSETVGLPPPDSFPGYRISGEIHRGGQAIVYQAMQESTKRRVAIKVMRAGPFAGPADQARFEQEAQILGQLNHPNIVTVHDSGSAAGSAYCVMDYITGQPLDEYVADARLTVPESLRLFLKICDAVNAAHLRGVIHRDLKPSNIRVDPSGEPHILDFGLAKVAEYDALADDRSDVLTATGQFVGSLPWASPEQAAGTPAGIDIRTDVYSLGLILYRMLTGKFPYKVTGTMPDVVDTILTADPVRLRALRPEIDDEVETMTLKCLAKEPDRRYQSAGELGRDIGRYLAGEAIEAKRDSVGYLLRKQLRRYRLPATIAAAFVVVVTVGFFTSLAFWRAAARERDAALAARAQARREAENAQAANDFLREVLSLASPAKAVGRQITVREAVGIAAGNIDALTAGQPETEAVVREVVGRTYHSLGYLDLASEQLRLALDIRRREFSAEHPDTLSSMRALAGVLGDLGQTEEAIGLLREAVAAQRRLLGETHSDTLRTCDTLAWFLYGQRQAAEAEPLFRRVLAGRRARDGRDAPATLKAMTNLAAALIEQGRLNEAEPLIAQAASKLPQVLDARHPDTLYTLSIRAWYLYTVGRYAEAERLYRGIVRDATEVLGPDHPHRLYWLGGLGWCLLKLGRLEEAERLLTEALAAQRRVLAEGHVHILESSEGLVRTLMAEGDFEQAEQLAVESFDVALTHHGPEHALTINAATVLADLYEAWNMPDRAAEWRMRASATQPAESPAPEGRKEVR